MTDTVLTEGQIIHICVTTPNEDLEEVIPFARAIESAVLQSPEIAALQKDAARYQWLRAHWHELAESYTDETGTIISGIRLYKADGFPPIEPRSMDAAIDAAMEDKS